MPSELPTHCAGCGGAIEQPHGGRRIWCSQRCRRDTLYGGTCEACGAKTNGAAGPGKAPTRCGACNQDAVGARWRQAARDRAELMLDMRRRGMTNNVIAHVLDIHPSSVSHSLRRLRESGVDVPLSPHYKTAVPAQAKGTPSLWERS